MASANRISGNSHSPTLPGDITYTYIDPETSEVATGTACSLVLCRASPVWRNFLYPRWGPTQFIDSGSGPLLPTSPQLPPPSVTTIDFTEDDYTALNILLDLAHQPQIEGIWYQIVEHRYMIAVLCDQYDCIKIVRHLVKNFPRDLCGYSYKDRYLLETLMVAWVFGYEEHFKLAVHCITNTIRVTKDGDLIDHNGDFFPSDIALPPGIMDMILASRLGGIKKILELAYTAVRPWKLEEHGKNTKVCVKSEPEHVNCGLFVCFGLLKAFQQMRIWPKVSGEEHGGSFRDLAEDFTRFSLDSALQQPAYHLRNYASENGLTNFPKEPDHYCLDRAPDFPIMALCASAEFEIPQEYNEHIWAQRKILREDMV